MAAKRRFVSPPIAGPCHRGWADPQCRACIVDAAQSPAGVQTAEGQQRAARWGPTESYLGGPYGCPGGIWCHAGLYASECSHQDRTYGGVLHTPRPQGEFGMIFGIRPVGVWNNGLFLSLGPRLIRHNSVTIDDVTLIVRPGTLLRPLRLPLPPPTLHPHPPLHERLR